MKFCALAETLRMSLRELQIRMRLLLLHYDFVSSAIILRNGASVSGKWRV